MRRVLHMVRKELIELRQDPRLFGIVIMAPIIQLTMLGYAATTDVRDVPLVVVDHQDGGRRSGAGTVAHSVLSASAGCTRAASRAG